jgi:anion-transporting  ArsA/GET3 family ATPase
MLDVVLADGSYDAIVVDVEPGGDGTVAIDLAIASGEHRGDVVRVVDHAPEGEPLELLGLPATLTVEGGEPSVRFDA